MNLSSRDYVESKRKLRGGPLKQKTSRCRFPMVLTADKTVESGLNDGVVNADIMPGSIAPRHNLENDGELLILNGE